MFAANWEIVALLIIVKDVLVNGKENKSGREDERRLRQPAKCIGIMCDSSRTSSNERKRYGVMSSITSARRNFVGKPLTHLLAQRSRAQNLMMDTASAPQCSTTVAYVSDTVDDGK
jgi:hypothetical protein